MTVLATTDTPGCRRGRPPRRSQRAAMVAGVARRPSPDRSDMRQLLASSRSWPGLRGVAISLQLGMLGDVTLLLTAAHAGRAPDSPHLRYTDPLIQEIRRAAAPKACLQMDFRRFGYEIRAIPHPAVDNVDFRAALTVKESQLYSQWVGPCPLFSPWLGHPDFQAIYQDAIPYTVVSRDRCYMLISLARYASHLTGHFAECGVYRGGTALLLARLLGDDANRRLYLFDSFKGLPKVNEKIDPWFSEGQYAAESVEAVEQLLTDFRSRVDIRCGWIPDTFHGLER